jgi:hypothetical protein
LTSGTVSFLSPILHIAFLAPKRTAIITDALAESSGGLAFEVKLVESPRHGNVQPPAHFLSPSAKGNQNDSVAPLTPETITEKLKRAEERRLSLEQLRATLLAAENNRPIEVIKIKDQQAEGKNNPKNLISVENFICCRIQKTNRRKITKKT